MSWETFTITGKGAPTLVVAAGDGPSLIIHNDNDTGQVLLGPDSGIGPGSQYIFPLAAQQYLGVDGKSDVYAIGALATDQHVINVVPGGLSFFQPPSTLIVSGSNSGILLYNPHPGLNDLIASLVSSVTVDKFGNVIRPNALTVYGANNESISIGVNGATTAVNFLTGDAIEKINAAIVSGVIGSGGTKQIGLFLEGPRQNTAGETDWVLQQLLSSSPDGTQGAQVAFDYVSDAQVETAIASIGQFGVAFFDFATPPSAAGGASRAFSSHGNLQFMSGNDGNQYDTGHKTLSLAANQVINSTSEVFFFNVGVQPGVSYRIHGMIEAVQGLGGAAAQFFGFGGPATIGPTRIRYIYIKDAQAGAGTTPSSWSNIGALTTIASPAYTTNSTFYFEFDGIVTFGAGGTFAMGFAEGTSGDNFTLIAGSFMDIAPVSS